MGADLEYQYRVVIHIKEDEFWDEQELIHGEVFLTPGEAQERREQIDLSRYPEGSETYIEARSFSDWSAVDG